MTDDPNDQRLRRDLRDAADERPPAGGWPAVRARAGRAERRQRAVLGLAAAVVVVAGVLAATALSGGDDEETSTDQPAATAPPTGDDVPTTTVGTTTTEPGAGEGPPPPPPPERYVAVTVDGRVVEGVTATGEQRDVGAFDDPTAALPEPPEGGPFTVVDVGLSPDGVVFVEGCCEPAAGAVFRTTLDGSVPLDFPAIAAGYSPAPSPDGSTVVVATPTGIGLLPADADDGAFSATIEGGQAGHPTWTLDGSVFAWDELGAPDDPTGTPVVRVANLGAGEARTLTPPEGATWTTPAFRADGLLVVAQREGTGFPASGPTAGVVVDPATGEQVGEVPLDGEVTTMRYDATGEWLLVTYADGRLVGIRQTETATGDEADTMVATEVLELATDIVAADW